MAEALTLADVAFLKQEASQNVLVDLATVDISEAQTLARLEALRRHFSGHEAGLLLSQARLRQRAVTKFGERAMQMLFDADALEQASHPLVRAYRARCLQAWGKVQYLLDAGCGMGADAFAFTEVVEHVHAVDIDPVRVAVARHNAEALGFSIDFSVADIREPLKRTYDVIFFDPARRHEGKRIFDIEAYHPPLSIMRDWRAPLIIVKLAPGVDWAQLDDYHGTLEFISVAGDLKEAVLWSNTDGGMRSRATLLQEDGKVHHFEASEQPEASTHAPSAWLLEPDPSIIRAGLVRQLGEALGAHQLHPEIAYLTSDSRPDSPFVRAWRIRSWQAYNVKQLRKALRQAGIGRVTVKKRGMPITPEIFIKDLKLDGKGERATLVLTRAGEGRVILICDDIEVT